LPDYWFPYAITNIVGVLLIILCYKWPKIGNVAWGIIFILAGIIFLVSLAPLGKGSAFPSTLLMAISPVLLQTRYKKT
jgi:hypothetical protein